ncbi:hypothetical protein FE257_009609 [Aspergillus nanangensis]|uniref:Uncharacterized protein n=1 Tax=Aspergillus nanangensis TaxID=2582783 RepID=A0AAD4GTV3_ASPNN|nr:hypothetical protein FE257_009609 [Aspergillus nanangensis]
MGTRGLEFIRCCGRYFVYYNHFDSYPEGLGFAIVNEIPTDPQKYQELLDPFILEWDPDCFCFREMAFAFLSLAAGQVTFDYPKCLNRNYRNEGYYVIPDTRLIDVVNVEEASIAEAVDFGLGQGLSSFYAVVFSVADVVMIHVETKHDGILYIQRSPLLNLFYWDNMSSSYSNGPRSRVSFVETDMTFTYLVRFFSLAENHRLAGAKSSLIPVEIMGSIMEMADFSTSNKLSRLSSDCRHLSERKLRLNDEYAVVGIDDDNSFILENLHSGEKISVKMESINQDFCEPQETCLSPIVGIADPFRRSILNTVKIYVQNIVPKSPFYEENLDMPKQALLTYKNSPHSAEDGERLFGLSDDIYPDEIENSWGNYIMTRLKAEDGYTYVMIDSASWACLLPLRYRELRMKHLYCNGLRLYIRHPLDESPQEWDKTRAYATNQLNRLEIFGDYRDYDVRGHPIIIAFGTRVKFYYYVHHLEATPSLESTSSYSKEIAARCVETNPAPRLVQIIPGDEPIDMKKPKDRDALEKWIAIFRNRKFDHEWNPFTETQRAYSRRKQRDVQTEDHDGDDFELSDETSGSSIVDE